MPAKGHHAADQFPHLALGTFRNLRKRQPQSHAQPFQQRADLCPLSLMLRCGLVSEKEVLVGELRRNEG